MIDNNNAEQVWQVISFALRDLAEVEGDTNIGKILADVNKHIDKLDRSGNKRHQQQLINLLRAEDSYESESVVLNAAYLKQLELNVDLDDVVNASTLVEAINRRIDELIGTCESLSGELEDLSKENVRLKDSFRNTAAINAMQGLLAATGEDMGGKDVADSAFMYADYLVEKLINSGQL